MERKKLKGQLTIAFYSDSSSDDGGGVSIRVEDATSDIQFLEVDMAYKDFAMALGGCYGRNCEMEVRGLEHVGKKRISESRTIEAPDLGYNREAYEAWLKANAQEEGWTISTYLGSQSSIERVYGKDPRHRDSNKVVLHYHAVKFVDTEGETNE